MLLLEILQTSNFKKFDKLQILQILQSSVRFLFNLRLHLIPSVVRIIF